MIKILFILILFPVFSIAAERVRRVSVAEDQIVTVRTCLGIATLIQVPDRPNSVVVGDQDSFKVEYLDQAITIKPLSGAAKSNLYIYTDWKRYNVELVSGSESHANYVVYLSSPKERSVSHLTSTQNLKANEIKWIKFSNFLKNESLKLSINRLGKTNQGLLLIEFTVSGQEKEEFKPEWLWLTQNGKTRPIHNLFLSSLSLTPTKSLSGVLQIKATEIDLDSAFRIELRKKRLSYLTITKASSWRF